MSLKKFKALLYLGWHFFIHFIKKLPFFAPKTRGKKAFLKNYKHDHIFAISQKDRKAMPNYSACYNCRLCDMVCPEFNPQNSLSSPSYLVSGYSRSLVDYTHLKQNFPFDCNSCNACESICPENVPIKDLILFVKENISLT